MPKARTPPCGSVRAAGKPRRRACCGGIAMARSSRGTLCPSAADADLAADRARMTARAVGCSCSSGGRGRARSVRAAKYRSADCVEASTAATRAASRSGSAARSAGGDGDAGGCCAVGGIVSRAGGAGANRGALGGLRTLPIADREEKLRATCGCRGSCGCGHACSPCCCCTIAAGLLCRRGLLCNTRRRPACMRPRADGEALALSIPSN
jgi:hypothetical protein